MARVLRSYDRQDVKEAQSNLALLFELDEHTFRLVTAFTEAWVNQALQFTPAPKEA